MDHMVSYPIHNHMYSTVSPIKLPHHLKRCADDIIHRLSAAKPGDVLADTNIADLRIALLLRRVHAKCRHSFVRAAGTGLQHTLTGQLQRYSCLKDCICNLSPRMQHFHACLIRGQVQVLVIKHAGCWNPQVACFD